MNTDSINTQRYFHSKAEQFDRFYADSGKLRKYFDRIFRAGIFDRYRLVFEHSGDVEGKRILDVGCGSGRYCVEFARSGASEVVGVDFAPNMLIIAEEAARINSVTNQCHFINTDFLQFEAEPKSFHLSLAMGVFDYIKEPEEFLSKMVQLTKGKVFASFPRKSLVRMPQRKLRYMFKGCPVYFYSKDRLSSCLQQIGCSDYELIKYKSSGYLLVINLSDKTI